MKFSNFFHKSFILFFSLTLLPLWGQQPVIRHLKPIRAVDFKVSNKGVHPVALHAIRKGEKPGAFKGVKTQFKPTVKILPKQKAILIQKKLDKGILKPQTLKQIHIESGKIYFDPQSGTVFKTFPVGKDSLVLRQPPLHTVIKDFKIPAQKVQINMANTSYTANGTKVTEEQASNGNYLLKMEFKDSVYSFNKKIKLEHGETNIKINLTLKGHLYLENPEIEARYTGRHGYSFTVNLHENADIQAELKATLTTEVEVPLWAFDIPAGDYGSCKVGVYAFIDMNGEVTLNYKIEQDVRIKAGLKGKTMAYYPRSYNPVINVQKSMKTDYEIDAKLKAFGGVEVTAQINVLKYKLAVVTAKAGPEIEIKTVDNGKNFEAKAGARFNVTAKLIKIDKTFTLYDKYYLLWEYKKKNYGGYLMEVKSADAYNDRVWGTVIKENDSTPYRGNLKIIVKHNGGVKQSYSTSTNEQGIFAMENIPLVKGDRIQIQIPGIPNASKAVAANLPFDEIRLYYADYYANKLEGSIASKIDLFPKQQSTAVSNVPIHNVPVQVGNHLPANKDLFSKNIKIDQNLFKNAITYHGDIEILTTSGVHKANLNIPAINLNTKKKRRKRKSGIAQLNKDAIKLSIKKKVINLPFGVFVVKNVDIKPYDRVKVRLNIDEFILESNTVIADGLVFTPSVDIDKQGGIKSPEIKASDSYVLINGLRSDATPTGKVHLLKGIDMKHTEPHRDLPNQTITFPHLKPFPQSVRPLVYYDVTADLTPSSQKGFAEAHTGAWRVKNIFYNRKHLVQIQKFDGHRFEYIGYTFDNLPVTYKYYQKKCSMDKDYLNKISKSTVPAKKVGNPLRFRFH